MPPRVVSTLAAVLLSLVVLPAGCGDEAGLNVAEGRYRLYIEGAHTDTLTGPALVREQRSGRIGIELGRRDEPGLSLEIVPGRAGTAGELQPGRYDVVTASLLNGPLPDSLSGVLAFLSTADRRFVASQGHVSVTETGPETIGGRVQFEMVEQTDSRLGSRTVRVRGALRAARP